MPLAFAQYTVSHSNATLHYCWRLQNVDDAQRAITFGRGMLINGRPCRTEIARVNRESFHSPQNLFGLGIDQRHRSGSLYLSKLNGGPITEEEAREILNGYGPIEMLWFASQTERELFDLPEGIFIRFAFFDDRRNAQMVFVPKKKENEVLLTTLRPSANRPLIVCGKSKVSKTHAPIQAVDYNKAFHLHFVARALAVLSLQLQYDATSMLDRFTLVTSLNTLLKTSLATCFKYTAVSSTARSFAKSPLYMVNRDFLNGWHKYCWHLPASGVNTFAFIEYEDPQSASLAVESSPNIYEGLNLRVEHKESTSSASRNLRGSTGSPRRQDVMIAFQRGISMGMTQTAQAQMMRPPGFPQDPYYSACDPPAAQHSIPATTSSNDSPTSPRHSSQLQYPSTTNASYEQCQHSSQIQYPCTTNASYEVYQQLQQQCVFHNSLLPQYQWPLTSTSSESHTTDETLGHETR